jgi:hypothetical protein
MHSCLQAEGQSIYQHGQSVKEHYFELLFMLRNDTVISGWKLPEWLFQFKNQILNHLMVDEIIEEYTLFHDCGKPFCLTIDQEGKRHFHNHADKSYEIWLQAGGNEQAAHLMKMDMLIHKIKAADIEDFIKKPEAITLLLAGLAEVHSNAKMFGGIESESFKIKWKQINKRGANICQKLFKE